jgi:hypothetical protein
VTQNTGEQSNTRGLVSPGSEGSLQTFIVPLFLYSPPNMVMSYILCKDPFSRNLLPIKGSKGLFLEEERKEKKGIAERNGE